MKPHSKKMDTQLFSMSAHSLKLTAHRKKMTAQFLSMTTQFVPMRLSYQNRAGPPVPVKPDFNNENVS
jgi:hypothetical protein